MLTQVSDTIVEQTEEQQVCCPEILKQINKFIGEVNKIPGRRIDDVTSYQKSESNTGYYEANLGEGQHIVFSTKETEIIIQELIESCINN